MKSSNTDDILTDLVARLGNISTASGYNYTPVYIGKVVRDLYEISEFPQISVMIGNSDIKSEDNSGTSFREHHNINILGFVNSVTDVGESGSLTTSAEGLISDIKKVMSSFMIKNINDSTSGYIGQNYFIDIHNKPINIFRFLDDKSNLGMIGFSFNIVSYRFDINYLDYWNKQNSEFNSTTNNWESSIWQ